MVLLHEDGREEPVVRASRIKQMAGVSTQIMLSRTMVEKVVEERTSFLTLDAMHDPRFEAQESIILQGTRSAMAAPLFDNEHVIGVLYADTTDPATRYSRDELRTFTILANLIGVKITQARLAAAEEEKRRLELQLQTAKEIMTRILPEHVAAIEGYEVCAFQEPSLTVGGDLYDARVLSDGRSMIMMGDVTGTGIGAALLVSNIMASLHLLLEESLTPLELVTRLNRHVWRSTDPMHFVTLFVGILDATTGRVDYVNAGHNPPLLVGADGAAEEIGATGVPVGTLEDFAFAAGSARIEPGGVLLLYSDGIPEAELPDGADFGMERLHAIVSRERARGAERIVASLREEVREFLGDTPAGDDITLLCVRRGG
jgi:sigma-B regulation protein RsbU (phosphoserine phosphatase)